VIFRSGYRKALVLLGTVLMLGVVTVPAHALAPPYQFEPTLSLTGDCSTVFPDDTPDPGCPGGEHPPSGRFDDPRSVAIDAYGNEYVASYAGDGEEGRIDVFDDEGNFITELLDPHGPKSIAVDRKGNLYAFEVVSSSLSEIVRYEPSLYKPEDGEIEYENPRVLIATDGDVREGGVAVDLSNDRLYATGGTSIAEYGSAAEGNKLLSTIEHPKLNYTNWVAVDGQRGRVYASFCKNVLSECGVLVFAADAPHELLHEIDGSEVPAKEFLSKKGWLALAVNEENGHLFVGDLEMTDRVYEFDQDYEHFSTITFVPFAGANASMQIAVSNSPLNKDARNFEYLFVPVVEAAGRVFAFSPPEQRPPEVKSLVAANISETEAELRATVDPKQIDTEYRIEYVSEGEFEESEFANAVLVGQGTILAASQPQQVSALIAGLEPGGSYRFRVFAENSAGSHEAIGLFTTYSDAPGEDACPNQIFRSGTSSGLPDCRAYELVTPADTNGRGTRGAGTEGDRFGMVQASPLGQAVSFESLGTMPGTEATGGLHGDAYLATRSSTGWTTALAGPTGREASKPEPGSFSPDQGYSFFVAFGEGSAVVGGEQTRYVRYPDGRSELIGRGSLGTDPTGARGKLITEGGGHIIFQTDPTGQTPTVQLEPNAPPAGTEAVYDRTLDEVTHVVSLLPGNVTPAAGQNAAYRGASADGEGIAFAIGNVLYLRVGNEVTYEIGENVTFAGVSDGGKRIFYVEGGDLFAFDTVGEEVIRFSQTGDAVPVNVAPEGTRAYFASEEAIADSGANPSGATAKEDSWNLYLSEEGQVSFVATVTDSDVEGKLHGSGARWDGLGLWTKALVERAPAIDPSRLVPDGSVLLFQSRADLTGFDPGGAPQIYRYDSVAGRLHCLSCPPTKTPATEGARLQSFVFDELAAPFSAYGFVPNLTPDGRRVFFESVEPLVSGDTNGVRDVYEWEENGVGSCERAGGCVYLISSGHSPRDNYLFGHSRSGDDVFFSTTDILVLGDQATTSVYDARVNGGFATPSSAGPCQGVDACRTGNPAPVLVTPTTRVQSPSPKVSRKCPKGKRKVKRRGKVVCVKKHRKHRRNKQRKASTERGVAK
jgi:hypothetical protein